MSKYAFRGDVEEGDKRSYEDWQDVSEKEGHTTSFSKSPNGFMAAKNYSKKGGRTTLVKTFDNNSRVVYEGGKRVYRDKAYRKDYR